MQLQHLNSLRLPTDFVDGRFPKVTAIAWAPNSYRMAIATTDRFITLYDEDGQQRDKFPTKPGGTSKSYVIKGLEFSADSSKLAVAQSDNIVFVYKLGNSWGDKKTICNKYPQSAAVTAICWPPQRPNDLVICTADGKVKIGTPANKSEVKISTDQYVVSVAHSTDGGAFIAGTVDGTLYKFTFPTADGRPSTQSVFASCGFVPSAIGWASHHVIVGGNSPTVKIFDVNGNEIQKFNYSAQIESEGIKEFSCCSIHPSGQIAVLGNFNRFFVYQYNGNRGQWEDSGATVVENLFTVTAARWKPDGAKLITGSLFGAVDAYDACLKRQIYKGTWEFNFTSLSSVIIKRVGGTNNNGGADGGKLSMRSVSGFEIKDLKVYQDKYVVGRTTETLLLGDLSRGLSSEIPWNHDGQKDGKDRGDKDKEKFLFDHDFAAMIYFRGELFIVEYGSNEILGSCRTEILNRHLVSIRIVDLKNKEGTWTAKKLAYLVDAQSIRILDFSPPSAARNAALGNNLSSSNTNEFTYSHDGRIDWLELNSTGNKLLYRDIHKSLHLLDLPTQTHQTLLNFCSYVQWVPDADVIVAQSRRSLMVWYSLENIGDITTIPIKGDVVQIIRGGGKTEVAIDEGVHQSSIPLDEGLIAFGSAIESHDFNRAVATLEIGQQQALANNNTSLLKSNESMWGQLYKLAMEEEDFFIAERCAAALGDLPKQRYLKKINSLLESNHGDKENSMVRCHIEMMAKQFKRSEATLLSAGQIDDAISMYRHLHKWDSALAVAEQTNSPNVSEVREEYFQYLLNTKQEEIAGELKERNGDYSEALQLYLKGNFPSKAASLILSQGMTNDAALCDRVGALLVSSKLWEKAGEFYESLGGSSKGEKALDCYVKGNIFHKAVDLAKKNFPSQVVKLHEQWGDYLMTQKQLDAASNHYIQAGADVKAINSAIEAGQFIKAQQIADNMDEKSAKPYFEKLGGYFAENKKFGEAEKYYMQAGLHKKVVEMYSSAGQWDKANSVASKFMSQDQIQGFYGQQAEKFEIAGKWKEAEKLYVQMGEIDVAITMFKKAKQWDDVIRLVNAHRKDDVSATHLEIATLLKSSGELRGAEIHFVKSKDGWKSAVSMYREKELWDDALRVAKSHGGPEAYKAVAFAFAKSVGGDAGIKQLIKKGLGDVAVDYAIKMRQWDEAFAIAEKAAKNKLGEVHYNYAMDLEDSGKYLEAEEAFLKAKKPKEVIGMWCHLKEFDHALRVADQYDPTELPTVMVAQGHAKKEEKQFSQAESFFLQAKKPEEAIKMYQEGGKFDDALRVARAHAPKLVSSIQQSKTQHVATSAPQDSLDQILAAARIAQNKLQYDKVIDLYLKITKDHSSDFDVIDMHWKAGLTICKQYVKQRFSSMLYEISGRMVEMGQIEQAAALLVDYDEMKKAIDVLIDAKKFDLAKEIATTPSLIQYVNEKHKSELLGKREYKDLESVNPDAAIDAYKENGEWHKVYELANKQGGSDAVMKYAAQQSVSLCKEGKFIAALQVFLQHGIAVVPNTFPVYKRIAVEIINNAGQEEGKASNRERDVDFNSKAADVLQGLRDLLQKLYSDLYAIDPRSKETLEFEHFAQIAHFAALRLQCHSNKLDDQFVKLSIAMLRYVKEYPIDKAFYDAAVACQPSSTPEFSGMTFIFFNRFVDLGDKMKDPDSSDIDNSDFINSDIPDPVDVRLPSKMFYQERIHAESRDWVLEKAMSRSADSETLFTRECDRCGKKTYGAALTCHSCKFSVEPCIISGFPIRKKERVQCRSCQKPANRDDWNKYVNKFKACPWCKEKQNPNF